MRVLREITQNCNNNRYYNKEMINRLYTSVNYNIQIIPTEANQSKNHTDIIVLKYY